MFLHLQTPIVTSCLCLALMFALYPPAAYPLEGIRLDLGRVETEFFTLVDLEASLQWQADDRLSLSLNAAEIQSSLIEAPTSFHMVCPDAEWREEHLRCADGWVELVGKDGRQTRIRMVLEMNTGTQRQWEIRTEPFTMELAPFSGLLQLWSESIPAKSISGGELHGSVRLRGEGAGLTGLWLQGSLEDFSLAADSSVEHLDAELDLAVERQEQEWQVAARMNLKQGALYLVAPLEILGDHPGFYIEPGDKPVVVELEASLDPQQGRYAIAHLFYAHPGVLELKLSAEGALSPTMDVTEFSVSFSAPKLEQTYPVYLQPLLLRTSVNDLQIAGSLEAGMDWRTGEVREAWLRIRDTYLADARNRFGIYGLRGDLRLDSGEAPVRSTLGWDGLSFYRLDLGGGDMVFESRADQIKVVEWQDIAILDGVFHIDNFSVRDFGKPDFSLAIDGKLSPVSLQEITQAMQWPLLSGTLAGRFSGLHYQHNALELNGDIHIEVFDGDITLRDLVITGLFSQYSVLQGDIDFERMDLEQLSQTFTFGRIEGSLSGSVRDLVLEDWSPVSFDAQFATIDDERRHRISRKALENLNTLGGGLSGTMSRGFLRLFPEYSYGQLGISCRLYANICELGGIRDVEGGSYLLTRGGLLPPWVEVRALGRSIAWDELIEGLLQISKGGYEIQ